MNARLRFRGKIRVSMKGLPSARYTKVEGCQRVRSFVGAAGVDVGETNLSRRSLFSLRKKSDHAETIYLHAGRVDIVSLDLNRTHSNHA